MLIAKGLMRWKNTDNLIQIFTNKDFLIKKKLIDVSNDLSTNGFQCPVPHHCPFFSLQDFKQTMR